MYIESKGDGGISKLYADRLLDLEKKSRATLVEFQSEDNPIIPSDLKMDDLGSEEFPREVVESIRDSELPQTERHELITYLLGCWYLDRIGGSWTYVPMPVDMPSVYLGFGIGIANESGTVLANIAESARDIVEGADMDFKEALFNANVESSEKPSDSRR